MTAADTGPHDVDPLRLRVAAHELGHAIAWQLADMPPTSIWVSGTGDRAQGHVDIASRPIQTVDDARGYLAGVLAGQEADRRWCDEHGLPYGAHTSTGDMANFRWHRRHSALCRSVSKADVRAHARRIVRAHWPRIVRLAPRLARTGRITL